MKIEKLEKYKKGDFVLKSKHIYAQDRLKIIRNHLFKKYNLIGGADKNSISAIKIEIDKYRNNIYSQDEL